MVSAARTISLGVIANAGSWCQGRHSCSTLSYAYTKYLITRLPDRYVVGYGIAFGRDEYEHDGSTNGFIGRDGYVLAGARFRSHGTDSAVLANEWALWFFE